MSMIVTKGLSKRYRETAALSDLSLEIQPGEVFGLLGPNGSGKTTTIRLLLGLIRPSSGRATVSGYDCWRRSFEVRQLVSYLPGELRMFGALTGYGMLKFLSDLRGGEGLDRAAAIAEQVMKLDIDRKVRTYSTGMKQKLALAQAFADPVDILILDEPTSSLDPSARNDVLKLVGAARAAGQTVIFSGHVLSEVEAVADRVAIMRRGRLMHIEDMHARRALRMLLARFADSVPGDWPAELELTLRRRVDEQTALFEHRGPVPALMAWLAGLRVEEVAVGTEDLRALYDLYHGPNVDDAA